MMIREFKWVTFLQSDFLVFDTYVHQSNEMSVFLHKSRSNYCWKSVWYGSNFDNTYISTAKKPPTHDIDQRKINKIVLH